MPSCGQPVTLTLPRSLPAQGYLGRQPELTPCRTVLPETPRALHTTPALSPVPYVTEDVTSPGTKTLSQGHELGGEAEPQGRWLSAGVLLPSTVPSLGSHPASGLRQQGALGLQFTSSGFLPSFVRQCLPDSLLRNPLGCIESARGQNGPLG